MSYSGYTNRLKDVLDRLLVTDSQENALIPKDAFRQVIERLMALPRHDGKVMFVGNGGSASIASHMAIDFWKNGKIKAISFNDSAQLTCLSNDLGYEKVFSAPIKEFALKGDALIAISSSGRSENILNAVDTAKLKGSFVVSLSGFSKDNPLRARGDINFFIDDSSYGIVESAHAVICHYILDSIVLSENR